jgi:alkylation response protein AidB-like acyl-CoA dehydrogenase
MTTLMNERQWIGREHPALGAANIRQALELWAERRSPNPVLRDRLAKLWIDSECLRLTNLRAAERETRGQPGPEGSAAKLFTALHMQQLYEFCVDLLHADGMVFELDLTADLEPEGSLAHRVQHLFLRSRANTIEGGTSEILRNILGERVLGLPGDLRVDRELPWRDVPRS